MMAQLKPMTHVYRCPQTHQALGELDADILRKVNEAVRAGALKNHAGETIQKIIAGGLISADQASIYPVRDGVPNLLIDDRIAFNDLYRSKQYQRVTPTHPSPHTAWGACALGRPKMRRSLLSTIIRGVGSIAIF